jgi:hypothetical protein
MTFDTRNGYRTTAKDAARLEGDLQRQRERTAATLAQLVADVHARRRVMNNQTLQAVLEAAGRLADLDEALRGS